MAGELAKVLWYYNLIPDVYNPIQKIICPFHSDVNPSMSVDLKRGTCYCFGCGEYFDAQRFVKSMESKYNGLNDLDALRMYFKILKSKKCSNIHINSATKKYKAPNKKQLYIEAYDYYNGLGTINWEDTDIEEAIKAREYMYNRGFSPSTLNKCKAKVTYNNQYGLIFPMLDNGKFRGWVCRTMKKDIENKRKYLYNEGFSRANTLVGNYGSEKYVFVVEGYMDRLKFIQYGIDNVVAILGWKMSSEQESKLKDKGITHVISALDNDECGRKGTKYLQTIFNVTRFTYLKGIKDPGEMQEENFKKMYRNTMNKYRDSIKKERK